MKKIISAVVLLSLSTVLSASQLESSERQAVSHVQKPFLDIQADGDLILDKRWRALQFYKDKDELSQVTKLSVSYSDLEDIGEIICSSAQGVCLRSLEFLTASNNLLPNLNPKISLLANLEQLNISNNRLTSISSFAPLVALKKLYYLDAQDNQIASVSEQEIEIVRPLLVQKVLVLLWGNPLDELSDRRWRNAYSRFYVGLDSRSDQ